MNSWLVSGKFTGDSWSWIAIGESVFTTIDPTTLNCMSHIGEITIITSVKCLVDILLALSERKADCYWYCLRKFLLLNGCRPISLAPWRQHCLRGEQHCGLQEGELRTRSGLQSAVPQAGWTLLGWNNRDGTWLEWESTAGADSVGP